MSCHIQPIVEGHGEVEAFPQLLRRIAGDFNVYDLRILRPIRAKRGDFNKQEKTTQLIKLAKSKIPTVPAVIIVLFDADTSCAKECAEQVRQWASTIIRDIPIFIVVPVQEYESWILGGLEGLKGYNHISSEPETFKYPEKIRNAKWRVSQQMVGNFSYSETIDQVKFSSQFSLPDAYSKCRSFRKLIKDCIAIFKHCSCIYAEPDWYKDRNQSPSTP